MNKITTINNIDNIAFLKEVKNIMSNYLKKEKGLIGKINQYILLTKGKGFRPILLYYVANASRASGAPHYQEKQCAQAAASVELLHIATLLHDDFLDHSNLRRGLPTVYARWGKKIAVLVGDYIYTKALELIADLPQKAPLNYLIQSTIAMVIGETEQLQYEGDILLDEENYMQIIRNKTASLMSATCQIASSLTGDAKHLDNWRKFGEKVGLAFQITDDILDYTSTVEKLGKLQGNDLTEKKITLPLIVALREDKANSGTLAEDLKIYFDNTNNKELKENLLQIIKNSNGIKYAKEKAKNLLKEAKEEIKFVPQCKEHNELLNLIDTIVTREY